MSLGRINQILNDLEICFIDCKFIFPKLPLPIKNSTTNSDQQPQNRRRQSGRARKFYTKMVKIVKYVINEVTSGAEPKEKFVNCIFSPDLDKNELEQQIECFETKHVKYSFVNCKFVQAEPKLTEAIGIKLRRLIGITFELSYLTGSVEVRNYTFKLKDLTKWTNQIVQQIIDEE